MNQMLESQSKRLLQIAEELEAAASHAKIAANHFKSGEVPRGCALVLRENTLVKLQKRTFMRITLFIVMSCFAFSAIAAEDCTSTDDMGKIEIICGGKGNCRQSKFTSKPNPEEYLKCLREEMNKLNSNSSSGGPKNLLTPSPKTSK